MILRVVPSFLSVALLLPKDGGGRERTTDGSLFSTMGSVSLRRGERSRFGSISRAQSCTGDLKSEAEVSMGGEKREEAAASF